MKSKDYVKGFSRVASACMIALTLSFVLMIVIACFTACDAAEPDISDARQNPRYIIDIQRDIVGGTQRVLSKATFDTDTGYVYIYTYNWENQSTYVVCVSTNLLILDKNGNIIYNNNESGEETNQ